MWEHSRKVGMELAQIAMIRFGEEAEEIDFVEGSRRSEHFSVRSS